MKVRSVSRGFGLLSFVVAALFLAPAHSAAQKASATQAQALADLAARILTCSIHPCLGESQKDVRAALGGRIVTDGIFYYSDLAEAYPATRGTLKGLVEWDFSGGLETISMKIVDFQVAASVFRAELEQSLPGCQMDGDAADDDQAESDEKEEIPENEWSCDAAGKGDEEVGIDVYFAPGLLIFEIGP